MGVEAEVGEDAGVDARVQRLDAAVEALGKPVSSSTLVTGTPAAAIFPAVEPVETSSTPASCRPRARSSSPVLS